MIDQTLGYVYLACPFIFSIANCPQYIMKGCDKMSILNTIICIFILTGCVMFLVSVVYLWLYRRYMSRKIDKIKKQIDDLRHN